MDYDASIDTSGLICPLPVLKARKRLTDLPKGAILRLIATDPASVIDVPHFCAEQGHQLAAREQDQEQHIFFIKKG